MTNTTPAIARNSVIVWSNAVRECIMATRAGPTVSSRSIAMVFDAIYNAWALYQDPLLVKPSFESKTLYDLQKSQIPSISGLDVQVYALSHAAKVVLNDLFPSQTTNIIDPAFLVCTEDLVTISDKPNFVSRAGGHGTIVGQEILSHYLYDGSNQKGVGSTESSYSDNSGYVPAGVFDLIDDSNNIENWADESIKYKWMPLKYLENDVEKIQKPHSPHWGKVRPFALPYGSVWRPSVRIIPTSEEIDEVLYATANLTEREKVIVELYAKNPGTDMPPGMWCDIASQVSELDDNTLEKDVKMFFTLGMALLDAGIAAWDVKYAYETIRPIALIRNVYRGSTLSGWGGPGTTGPETINAEDWMAYQPSDNLTPPFPEVVSGHSTFSSAAANVLAMLRKSDYATFTLSMPANGIHFDPTYPVEDTNLNYTTFSSCADDAGYSRILGGIHFEQGNLLGKSLGKQIGLNVVNKCLSLFNEY